MPPGLDVLKHIVVLMMENRSFDHMLGSLKAVNPAIDGLAGNETNPDSTGVPVSVAPNAAYQSQLDPDPDHHFPAVDLQIFGGITTAQDPNRQANMQGFVKSYFNQQFNIAHSHLIMNYFPQQMLPVLTGLAKEFAVFNRWFSSIPGPTLCNRAFAHYGTSFGQVSMDVFYWNKQYLSVYERLVAAGHTAKLYYYDEASSSLEVVNLLQNQPALFGSFQDFIRDCNRNLLPDYCFIEPNYTDHDAPDGSGELIASDQHPDHDVRAGEQYIASVYNAIRQNPNLWPNTALLIVYDEHGGTFDHVPPPACLPDGFVAQPSATGTPRSRPPSPSISWAPTPTVPRARSPPTPSSATSLFPRCEPMTTAPHFPTDIRGDTYGTDSSTPSPAGSLQQEPPRLRPDPGAGESLQACRAETLSGPAASHPSA
jgi:phospholipase C